MHIGLSNRKKVYTEGFSLVELMVALTIFSIVMTISTGTLLIFIDGNAKAQSENTAITNLTFALDSMTRNIRTGREFYCTQYNDTAIDGNISSAFKDKVTNPVSGRDEWPVSDCSGGQGGLVFTPGFQSGVRMGYRFNEDTNINAIEQRIWNSNDSTDTGWLAITSLGQGNTGVTGATVIDFFEFIVTGSEDAVTTGDQFQPTVSMSLRGIAGEGQGGLESEFRIQSNITQRVLDF